MAQTNHRCGLPPAAWLAATGLLPDTSRQPPCPMTSAGPRPVSNDFSSALAPGTGPGAAFRPEPASGQSSGPGSGPCSDAASAAGAGSGPGADPAQGAGSSGEGPSAGPAPGAGSGQKPASAPSAAVGCWRGSRARRAGSSGPSGAEFCMDLAGWQLPARPPSIRMHRRSPFSEQNSRLSSAVAITNGCPETTPVNAHWIERACVVALAPACPPATDHCAADWPPFPHNHLTGALHGLHPAQTRLRLRRT